MAIRCARWEPQTFGYLLPNWWGGRTLRAWPPGLLAEKAAANFETDNSWIPAGELGQVLHCINQLDPTASRYRARREASRRSDDPRPASRASEPGRSGLRDCDRDPPGFLPHAHLQGMDGLTI